MRIQIIHGVQKYNLDVPDSSMIQQRVSDGNQADGDRKETQTEEAAAIEEWNIKRLKEEIEKLTEIPVDRQRLIRKGTTLFGNDTPIASLNFIPGEKIMVLGQKPEVGESPAMKSLHTIEKTVLNGIENKIKDVDGRLQGIHQGFLSKSLVDPSLNDLDKQLKCLGEDCMKTLELMDAMQLGDEINDKARAKRKTLVVRVQDLLRWHDDLLVRLDSITSEIKLKQSNGILRDQ